MFRKMGREEYCEKENLQQYFLSHDIDEVIKKILENPSEELIHQLMDIDEVIKKILENPSEELIHQLMYYVELRTLRNFQKPSQFTFLEDTIRENYEN